MIVQLMLGNNRSITLDENIVMAIPCNLMANEERRERGFENNI